MLSFFISHAIGPTDLLVTSTATQFISYQLFIINFSEAEIGDDLLQGLAA
jgi:hypothetical protein